MNREYLASVDNFDIYIKHTKNLKDFFSYFEYISTTE